MEGIENIDKRYKNNEIIRFKNQTFRAPENCQWKLFEAVHPSCKQKYIYWKCKWSDECSYNSWYTGW